MSDIDDKLARAWRDASREEPSAALDASLRAAARRAVQAGPGRASQERHMRSWPLATAAVLAVLSFGILQLTPPDEVAPGMVAENNVLSPVARQAEPAAISAKQESLPAAAPAPASPSSSDARNASPYAQLDSATRTAKGRVGESTPAGAEKKVLGEGVPDRDAERDHGWARTQLAQAPATTPTPPSANAAAPAKEELAKDKQNPAPASAPPAVTAAPRPDPFPAAGSANTKAIEAEPRPPAQAGAVAPGRLTMPPQERAKLAEATDSPSPAADSASTSAAATAGGAKPQANVETRRAEPMRSTPSTPLAKSAVPTDAVKDAPVKPPEEWIKLIRKLKSEGRNDDAARELAAFRAAYKERADTLLPADLRAAPR